MALTRQTTTDDPPAGVVRWLISADESGMHGSRFYGFGSLWMAWQRRGDFAAIISRLRTEHGYTSEAKWNSVGRTALPFYEDLVEEFFRAPWLSFHCLLVEKAVIRKELHGGDYDLARRKMFTKLLTNKIQRRLRLQPHRRQTFRVWVDPIHSRYSKADEAAEVIANNVLGPVLQPKAIDGVFTRDSKDTPSIQLCDLLLGAVRSAWHEEATSEAKLELRAWIAYHLGWTDLHADTRPAERKFNTWVFYDVSRGPRTTLTRDVSLVYPLAPTR